MHGCLRYYTQRGRFFPKVSGNKPPPSPISHRPARSQSQPSNLPSHRSPRQGSERGGSRDTASRGSSIHWMGSAHSSATPDTHAGTEPARRPSGTTSLPKLTPRARRGVVDHQQASSSTTTTTRSARQRKFTGHELAVAARAAPTAHYSTPSPRAPTSEADPASTAPAMLTGVRTPPNAVGAFRTPQAYVCGVCVCVCM